jgi:hypothetical protein
MPLVTQSDPGTENFGIANGHTMLHQWYDPSLQGVHNTASLDANQEQCHARDRVVATVTSCFESLLDHRVEQDWYDSDNTLQVYVFRVSICRTD